MRVWSLAFEITTNALNLGCCAKAASPENAEIRMMARMNGTDDFVIAKKLGWRYLVGSSRYELAIGRF
jgi:hypothetical protein